MKISLIVMISMLVEYILSTKLKLKFRKRNQPKPKYKGTPYEEFPRDNKTGVPVIPTQEEL